MIRAFQHGRLCGLALAVVVAATGIAQAQKKDAFARRDTNNDGVITQQEWTASGERAVRRLDANGDGAVSRQEFIEFQKQRAARVSDRVFRRLEKRGRKVLELASIRREKRRKRLQRFDANQDGQISKAELRTGLEQSATRRMKRLFRRFDKDRDGTISRAERRAINDRRFARLDSDRNGKLTRSEMTVARKRFQARKKQRADGRGANAGGPKKPESYRQ